MALHLAVVLLFQHHSGCMIHAPGKCVPQIVTCLADYMSPEDHKKISSYQALVVKQLTKGGESASPTDDKLQERVSEKSVEVLLEEDLDKIKELALNDKKGNAVHNGD